MTENFNLCNSVSPRNNLGNRLKKSKGTIPTFVSHEKSTFYSSIDFFVEVFDLLSHVSFLQADPFVTLSELVN